jgi:hypothetical protein
MGGKMEHLHFELQANAGQVVRVELNQQANVRLLDSINYMHYCRGGRYRYHGGVQQVSPAFIPVPHAGHWHVAIDLGGGRGYIQAAVELV